MSPFDKIIFDPAFDLTGAALVEASAGTGKTYQIQNTYLRLVIVNGLSVESILVVTFTEAATSELRERLRRILVKSHAYLTGLLSSDDSDYRRLDQIMALKINGSRNADNFKERLLRIKSALMDFDNAAIFTIHGFCNRVLEGNAFECGHDPDAELLADDSEVIRDICHNWWRQHAYRMKRADDSIPFDGPDELYQMTVEALARPDAELAPSLTQLASDELAEEDAGKLCVVRKIQEVKEIAAAVRARIRQRRMLTYRDMLLNVREALQDVTLGPLLRNVLRDEFGAALIDEFQDTDPVQYGIFDEIFSGAGIPLLFVGDPKQAIYGFRSGDIYTYYRAREKIAVDRRLSLVKNYRSDELLVNAVNELFCKTGGEEPFLSKQINYTKIAANGLERGRHFTINGKRPQRPLRFWHYTWKKYSKKVPGESSPFARHVYARVADEIVELLSDERIMLGKRRLIPSDIAVLVMTHNEAEYIYNELQRRQVNAVKQKSGNVFDSDEAVAIAHLMRALLVPGDAVALQSVLATDIMPCQAADLLRYSCADSPSVSTVGNTERSLDFWMDLFSEAGRIWKQNSFIEAFGYIENHAGLRAHVAGLDEGERSLTNLLQLTELIHHAAREQQLGPEGLLRWVMRQLDEKTRAQDETFNMRISSDASAVQIMTVFKSKGLEFPVVYIPTMWRRSAQGGARRRKSLTYHQDGRMMLNYDKDDQRAINKMRQEALEENLRMIYVAVTRAANYACVVSISQGDGESYAMKRLIDRLPSELKYIKKAEYAGDDPAEIPVICLEQDEAGVTAPVVFGEPVVDKAHGHVSFSALGANLPSYDMSKLRDIDENDNDGAESDRTGKVVDIFSIPGGAKTGNCWHDILERIDFKATSSTIAEEVDAALDVTGICDDPVPRNVAAKRDAVHKMIKSVLNAPLIATDGEVFSLNKIEMARRRSELQFDFALKQKGRQTLLGGLAEVISRYWSGKAVDSAFLTQLEKSDKRLPLGYMTGFIDLVFNHNDRFYIVDWKSNRLDGRIESFDTAGMAEEMRRHWYYLQYMIYAVALDAFLRHKLSGYSFKKHFGGVFYVFLRGVDSQSQRGVFHDPLSAELVTQLSAVLTDGGEGGGIV